MKNTNLEPWRRRVLVGAILLGTGAAIGGGAGALAVDNDRSTSNVLDGPMIVPYEGTLRKDGAPIGGAREMRFELYDAPSGGSPVWAEEQTILFYNGQFSVGLGSGTPDTSVTGSKTLRDIVLDGEQLYIGLQIKSVSSGAFVPLQGRQAIEAVPHAAWSANSADFSAGSTVRVARDAVISGDLNTPTIQVDEITSPSQSHVRVESAMQVNASRLRLGAQGDTAMSRSTGFSGLTLNPLEEFAGGVRVDTRLSVTLGFEPEGDLDLNTQEIYMDEILANNATSPFTLAGQPRKFNNTGIELYNTNNNLPSGNAIFSVLKSDGSERLRVDHFPTTTFVGGVDVGGMLVTRATTVQSQVDAGSLEFEGKLIGLSASFAGSIDNDANSPLDLNVSSGDGFCFLTRININHGNVNADKMWCRVYDDGSDWRLEMREGSSSTQGSVICEAYCVEY